MLRELPVLFWLLVSLAVAGAGLCVASAAHKSFLVESSASMAAGVLEREFIDTQHLSPEQVQRLQRTLKAIKGGERYLSDLHESLWRIASLGFASLATGCLVCAILVFRAVRQQAGRRAG